MKVSQIDRKTQKGAMTKIVNEPGGKGEFNGSMGISALSEKSKVKP